MASRTADRRAASIRRPSAKIRPIRVRGLACKSGLHSDTLPEICLVQGKRLRPSARGDQSWLVCRIVVHPPRRRQRLIQLKEVPQAASIASSNRLLGYGVTSQAHTVSNPGDRQFGCRQPEEQEMTLVAVPKQPANPRGAASEGGRERASRSASTNSETSRTSTRSRPGSVDLPAPFGPARTTTEGRSAGKTVRHWVHSRRPPGNLAMSTKRCTELTIMVEIDGPILQHGLQGFQGRRIYVPRAVE